jgi:hypothetical protein
LLVRAHPFSVPLPDLDDRVFALIINRVIHG